MQIVYCDACGKLIREGESQATAAGQWFCSVCQAKATASTAQHPIPAPADTTVRDVSKPNTASQSAIPPSTRRIASSQKPAKAGSSATGSSPSRNLLFAASAGVFVLVLAAILQPTRYGTAQRTTASRPTSAVNPAKPAATSGPAQTQAQSIQTAVAASQPKPAEPAEAPGPTMEEIREKFAAKRLDEILSLAQSGKLSDAALRKELMQLNGSHGSTQAGRAAKAKLDSLPPSAPVTNQPLTTAGESNPDAQTKGKVLFRWKASSANDGIWWNSGSKDTEVKADGAYAWKAQPLDGQYFTNKLGLGPCNEARFGATTVLRIHCRLDHGKNLFLHIMIGDQMVEAVERNAPSGKWGWIEFRAASFTKALKTGKPPTAVGGVINGGSLLGHTSKAPNTLWVDAFEVVDEGTQ